MDPHSTKTVDSKTLVRCRLGGFWWLIVLVVAGLSVFFIAAPHLSSSPSPAEQKSDFAFFTVFGLLFLLPSFYAIGLLWIAEIRATETGLRWLTLRGWKIVAWEEVTDFYEKRMEKADVIETLVGNLTLPKDTWTNAHTLREVVAQRATKAPNAEWGEQGARQKERWPITFEYKSQVNDLPDWLWYGLCGGMLITAAGFLQDVIPRILRDAAVFGWPMTLTEIGFLVGFFGGLPLLACATIDSQRRSLRSRKGQRITATSEGLTYQDPTQQRHIPWHEIGLIYLEGSEGGMKSARQVVVGKLLQFDFTLQLENVYMLQRLISRYASDAVEKGKALTKDEEDLLPQSDLSVSSKRLYHYRTRSNRSALWMLATPMLAGLILVYEVRAELNPNLTEPQAWGMTVLFGLPFLWAWWRYRAASIRTDSLGITQHTITGKRFISWSDIQDYGLNGEEASFGTITGSQQQIRFWLNIAGREHLLQEITRRAVNSRSKEWKKRERS